MAKKIYSDEERLFRHRISCQIYREKNKEKIKKYYYDNLEKHKKWRKDWIKNNKEKSELYKKKYRMENSERLKELSRKHYLKDRKRYLERSKAQQSKNPEKYKIYLKEYYEKNSGKLKTKQSKYKKENKDVVNINCQKRRALKRMAKGSFTKNEWVEMKKMNEYTCLICKKCEPEIQLTIDHKIPLSKGGSNEISNIQPLCRTCNCSKGAKIIYERI